MLGLVRNVTVDSATVCVAVKTDQGAFSNDGGILALRAVDTDYVALGGLCHAGPCLLRAKEPPRRPQGGLSRRRACGRRWAWHAARCGA